MNPPEQPETCECSCGCKRRPMDHSPLVVSPALCGLCLYGCAP